MDLLSAEPFVFPVIPFEQVAIDFGLDAEAGQLACAARSLQWAGKYVDKGPSSELGAEAPGVALSLLSQWQIGKPSMLAREAPRSLAVPRDVKRREHFTHQFVYFRRLLSEGPLPVRDVLWIYTELVRMGFTFYLLVEQELSNIGSLNVESWDPVDRVDREAEAIRLVLDR